MMAFQTAAPARQPRFAPEPRQKSAGRRGWAAAGIMVAGTLAIALASYSLSLKVSAERAATVKLAKQNVALERELKALDAELRVRMRLPQLQRWNDEVLALQPITAQQYLGNPLHLAAYGTQPSVTAPVAAAAPTLQLTLRTDVATRPGAPEAPARALTAAVLPRPQSPPLAKGATVAAPSAPVAMDPVLVAAIDAMAREAASAEPAPVDLLRQVEMPDAPSGGN